MHMEIFALLKNTTYFMYLLLLWFCVNKTTFLVPYIVLLFNIKILEKYTIILHLCCFQIFFIL